MVLFSGLLSRLRTGFCVCYYEKQAFSSVCSLLIMSLIYAWSCDSFGLSIKGFINENCFFLSRKGFQIGAFEINVQKKLSSWLLTVILIKYLHSEFLFLLLRKMSIMLLIFRSYCMFGVNFAITSVLSIHTYVPYSGTSLLWFCKCLNNS